MRRYVSSLRPAYASTRMLDERNRFLRNLMGNIVVLMHMFKEVVVVVLGGLACPGRTSIHVADDFHLVGPDFQLRIAVSFPDKHCVDSTRQRDWCCSHTIVQRDTYQRIP